MKRRIALTMGFLDGSTLCFAGECQTDSAVNQQRAQAVKNPLKALEEPDPREDEGTAHQQRAENSPE